MAVSAPFKAIVHFASTFLFQAAALGAGLSGWAKGPALLDVNFEIGRVEPTILLRRRLSRANQLPPLSLHFDQLLRRHISSIDVLDGRLLQSHLRLLLLHLLRP